ncbi:MAG TPA: GNAT family N-acetyltransferase [Taishania sp.]|nr:GNAT family N-acetyltransferase [Taishania sp.]
MNTSFTHAEEKTLGRIYIFVDGKEGGFIEYLIRADNSINAHETLVHERFRGKGLAGLLFDELIAYSKTKNYKIYPTCSFIVKSFERHQELSDLLAADYKNA